MIRYKSPNFAVLLRPMFFAQGEYNNVLYLAPNIQNTFQQMVGIDCKTKTIIADSNSYFTDDHFVTWFKEPLVQHYEERYGIYKGLEATYTKLLQNKQLPTIVPYSCVVMFCNSFTGTNSGHDLGTIFGSILYCREQNLSCKVIMHKACYPRIKEIVELFYDNWYTIDFDHVYFFPKVHFVHVDPRFLNHCGYNQNVIDLTNEITSRSHDWLVARNKTYEVNQRCLLLKRPSHSAFRRHDVLEGDQFIKRAKEEGWIVMNPEMDDMRWMICTLAYASRIVCSHGAIMWTHMLFFNRDAVIIHLELGGEKAYSYLQSHPKFHVVVLANTNLDSIGNASIWHDIHNV